jgi:hypothetical protein
MELPVFFRVQQFRYNWRKRPAGSKTPKVYGGGLGCNNLL